MKRIVTIGLAVLALSVGLAAIAPAQTPTINGAIIKLNVFNDCPVAVRTSSGAYPNITIDENDPFGCSGGLNRDVWQLSSNGGVSETAFPNWCNFRLDADVLVSGADPADLEGGLLLSPWWADGTDGQFMINPNTGEIATFGGRLPFSSNHAAAPYNFTQPNYVNNTVIHMAMLYLAGPVDPTISGIPAQITYFTVNGGVPYSFGPVNFDEGNVTENPPHGLWGILQPAYVGGYLQAGHNGAPTTAHGVWDNITFTDETSTPAKNTTWGALKSLYR